MGTPIPKMTNRDIYRKVRDHLLTQNAKSLMEDGTVSAYRGTEGRKCAIGCLINDKDYSPELENCMVYEARVREAVARSLGVLMSDFTLSLLSDLQEIHDQHEPRDWEEQLTKLEMRTQL